MRYTDMRLISIPKNLIHTRFISDSKGFTLVEFLIGMVLGLIVLGALTSVFIIQNEHYTQEEQIVEIQEYARAGMQMMVSDLLMAGYDPMGSANAGIIAASATSIEFTMDFRGDADGSDPDGNADDAQEHITYSFDAANNEIDRDDGSPMPLVENIQSLAFTYSDAFGNPAVIPGEIDRVRRITIQITAITKNGDRTKTLTCEVWPRNLGL